MKPRRRAAVSLAALALARPAASRRRRLRRPAAGFHRRHAIRFRRSQMPASLMMAAIYRRNDFDFRR